ncbi:MAG: hypothetical protein M3436_08405 [Pseudomonadota bacterium]|nr:hypothetical protein [Pseudomonadota bacterium]
MQRLIQAQLIETLRPQSPEHRADALLKLSHGLLAGPERFRNSGVLPALKKAMDGREMNGNGKQKGRHIIV